MPAAVLTALPVYNEAGHLTEVLDQVVGFCPEVLVVDDGSTDRTASLLGVRKDIHVVTHTANRGYGAALQSAFDYAISNGYEVLVTIDCDGQHEPSRVPSIVEQLQLQQVDILSGSRYLEKFAGDTHPPEDRRKINVEITRRLNELLGLQLTDAFCGFKAYRTDALERLRLAEPGYAMPIELWVQAAALGLSIAEYAIPLIYLDEDRSFGGSLDDADRRMSYYLDVLDRVLAARPPR